MAQDGRSGTWKALVVVLVLVVAGVLLWSGTRPMPAGGIPVRIALTGGEGVDEVQCGDLDTAGLIAMMRAAQAGKAKKREYELTLFPGSLLMVQLKSRAGGKRREVSFPYVYGGRRSRLVFSRRGPTVFLNNRLVFLDLTQPEGFQWLRGREAGDLGTIRSIRLSGDRKTDLLALSRFAGSGVFVALSREFSAKKRPDVVKALAGVKPTGLMTEHDVDGLQEVLRPLGDLTHLFVHGEALPDLSHHPKLKWLAFTFGNDKEPSLAPLANAKQLECLLLAKSGRVKDLKPIGNLKNLRSLVLKDCDRVKDLSVFAGLGNLRCLTLSDCEGLEDISAITKLRRLSQAVIAPMPQGVRDLRPLTSLANLKVLVVDAKGLKERKSEYDEVRKALPECEIIGFCMGSAWILAVVPAGVFLGLLSRRRSHLARPRR